MIKLFTKILLLLLLLIVADRIIGTVLEKLFYKQQHGDDAVTIQLLDSTQADILIFGSSRASHHYIFDTIQKVSGQSAYNAGRDNMGIHFTEATIREVLKRYHPKHIILDIIPYNFLKGNQNNEKYFETQTTVLLPFANRHRGLYESVEQINKMEFWKAKLIKSYAYNSLVGTIFQNAYTHIGHMQYKGYEPLNGKIDTVTYTKPMFEIPTIKNEIDTSAFDLLRNCLALCKQNHVKTTICFSPFYFEYHHEPLLLQAFQKICAENDCTLLDFSADTQFVKKPELFYDEMHLNHEGAILFSKKLMVQISAKQ